MSEREHHMFDVEITTDQTDNRGDNIVHSLKATTDQVNAITMTLNAGLDYLTVTDIWGTVWHVRKMDINSATITPA